MSMKKVLAAAAFASSMWAGSAHSGAILYWTDFALGTDRMAAALAASSHTVTTATSEGDFVTQVGAGGWDLVIFMNQNTGNASAHAATIGWVTGGGRAILADWTQNGTTSAPFDASYTGSNNQTSVTVTGVLAAGLTNPVLLLNPGWGTFSMGMSATGGGTSSGDFGNGDDAIVIGASGRTIVNGFLNDTFADAASGIQLYTNEINLLLGEVSVPIPGTLLLVGAGLLVLGVRRRVPC